MTFDKALERVYLCRSAIAMPPECATLNLTRLLRVIANVPTGTGLVGLVSSMPLARRRRLWGVIDSHISSAFLCIVRVEPLCKCCRGRSINYTAVNSTCGARALVLTSWQQSTGANTHIQNQITRAHTRTHTHKHKQHDIGCRIYMSDSIDSRRAISDCVCAHAKHASHLNFP